METNVLIRSNRATPTAFLRQLRSQLARSLLQQVKLVLDDPSELAQRAADACTTPEALLASEIAASAILLLPATDAPWAGN